jgi:hypothetical protein
MLKKRHYVNSGNYCLEWDWNTRSLYSSCLVDQLVFENRVMRIFRPRGDEVTEDWRKLHNEELHNLYSSPNII